MPDSELESIRQRWTRRLSGLRRKLRWHQSAEAIALLLAGTVLAVLLTGLIDYRFELSASVRRLVILVCGGTLAYSAWVRLAQPLRAKLELIDVAAIIDRAISSQETAKPLPQPSSATDRPHRPGRLTSSAARVLDHSTDQPAHQSTSASPLLRKAIAQSDETLSQFPMDQALNSAHLRKNLAGTITALIIPIAIAFAIPATTKVWAARWIGGDDVSYPRNTSIQIIGLRDGLLQVPRGEPARIAVQVDDKAEPTSVVWLRLDPTDSDRITSTLDAYGTNTTETSPTTTTDFRGDLPPLTTLTSAAVWAGDARPLRFQIAPVDRPQVVGLTLTAKHPAEENASTFDLASTSDVRLLRDSQVTLNVVTTGNVAAQFETNAKIATEKSDSTTHTVHWTQDEATSIRIALTSAESGLESFPRTVTVGLLPDRAPSVTLRHSGVRLRVTPIATIPLSVTARDDFGIDTLSITGDITRLAIPSLNTPSNDQQPTDDIKNPAAKPATTENPANATDESPPSPNTASSKTPPSGTGPIELFNSKGQTALRVDRDHRLDLATLQLKPGDVVKATALATDAAYAGPQQRRSRTITFRVVKDEDLFREIKLRLQQLRARLRKATDAADEFRIEIAKADLPSDGSMLSRKYQVSRREIGTVSQQIKQSAVEIELNHLGGSDSEEVSEQLQRTIVMPLDRLLAGSMDRQRVTLGDLAKAKQADQDTNRQEAVTRQEEIVASLNEVLKNMNQWDSFVDLINQVNFVIDKEKQVYEGIKSLGNNPAGNNPRAPMESRPAATDKPTKDAADDIFD